MVLEKWREDQQKIFEGPLSRGASDSSQHRAHLGHKGQSYWLIPRGGSWMMSWKMDEGSTLGVLGCQGKHSFSSRRCAVFPFRN